MGLDQSVMVNPAQEVKFPEDTKDGPCKYPLSIETAEKESREADERPKYELDIVSPVADRNSRKAVPATAEEKGEEVVPEDAKEDGPRKYELRIEEAVAARPKYPLTIGADDADSERYPGVIVPAKEESRKAVSAAAAVSAEGPTPGAAIDVSAGVEGPDGDIKDPKDSGLFSEWYKEIEDWINEHFFKKEVELKALYANDVKVLKAKYTKDVELLAHHVKKQGQQIKDLHAKLADIQVLPYGPRPL